jgi:hypothetical protein
MNPRDWFTLGLRLFGIYQLIDTIEYFFTSLSISAGVYGTSHGSASWYMLVTFVHFFLSVWLLKFAPQTARFFYPDTSVRKDSSDENSSRNATPPI